MGNCFGSSSAVDSPPSRPATITLPPSKKQRKGEQAFVTDGVISLRDQASIYHEKLVQCAKESQDDTNKKASNLILQSQNWQTSGEIDLHGLYLNEAIDATTAFLKHWCKKSNYKNRKTVLVITGAGHHSSDHKAVIRPKVEKLLQQQGHIYESVHGNGAFKVTLKPSQ
jgi:DNA-nicking Smr family endonuclease